MNEFPDLAMGSNQAVLKVIDDVLLAQAGWLWRETHKVASPGEQVAPLPWVAEERRKSMLGQNLLQVADYANGGLTHPECGQNECRSSIAFIFWIIPFMIFVFALPRSVC